MPVELDHLFICVSPGAPEAEELIRFGLREGPPNQHPGQGTANRRFSFLNAMIELIWVHDQQEAQSAATRPTQLWERWSERQRGSCPYGICVRPADAAGDAIPFPAWTYQPSYLPDPLAMHIGEAKITEPMWVYLAFMRRAHREANFVEHACGLRVITALTMTTPVLFKSAASHIMGEQNVIATQTGTGYLLEVEFDHRRNDQSRDFRPHLPLIFRF